MPRSRISISGAVPAPVLSVYELLADYRDQHPRILPPAHFRNFVVEHGGRGAGTIIRFEFLMGGQVYPARAEVSEPVPGERLEERDLSTGAVTSFTLRPLSDRETEVTIATEWDRPGIRGWLEKYLAPLLMRGIYRQELALLREQVSIPALRRSA